MSKLERLISHGWFWVVLTCALICFVYLVSGLSSGFSISQGMVLLVPLAFYALAIKIFGDGSVIEMGVVALEMAVLLAILIPLYNRWQHPPKRHHHSVSTSPQKSSKNTQKPSS